MSSQHIQSRLVPLFQINNAIHFVTAVAAVLLLVLLIGRSAVFLMRVVNEAGLPVPASTLEVASPCNEVKNEATYVEYYASQYSRLGSNCE